MVILPQLIPITDAIGVSCGHKYTAILKNDGTVFTFGNNYDSQLGHGTQGNPILVPTLIEGHTDIIAVSCGYQYTAILKNNGKVFTFGNNNDGQLGHETKEDALIPMEISGNHTDIIAISCGLYHTAILKNDGTVLTFGSNNLGRLGRAGDNLSLIHI